MRGYAPATQGVHLGLNQEALRSRLQRELELVTAEAIAVAQPLSPQQLLWNPPGGGWSIGQVLEHIVVSADSYLTKLRGLVYFHHAAHAELGATEWEPSLSGWMLVSGLRQSWKMPAPGSWKVNGHPRADVLAAFLDRQDAITRLLRASAALDWRRVRLSSPISTMIRLNLGDCFTVLVVHAQRHVGQMQRIRAESSFPVV